MDFIERKLLLTGIFAAVCIGTAQHQLLDALESADETEVYMSLTSGKRSSEDMMNEGPCCGPTFLLPGALMPRHIWFQALGIRSLLRNVGYE